VPKLLAVSAVFGQPETFGLTLSTIDDTPVLTEVETGSQIDLARAADLAGISVDELYRLNPGFNRWATDPDGPHRLLLPLERAPTFRTELAALDPNGLLHWRRHKIRPGENLGVIARRYHTTPAVLRQVNQLDGNLIRAGHHLLIPIASKPASSYVLSANQRQIRGAGKPPKNQRGGQTAQIGIRQGDPHGA